MVRMLALALPLALSGCMMELLTTTAIQGELAKESAQAGVQALDHAKESKSRTEAEYAIRAYQAEHGANPPSLAALVPAYLPSVPMHADGSPFGYDAATGVLMDSPAAAPHGAPYTEEDWRSHRRIEDAIYAYWQSTGDYPRTLDELVPAYIDRVPLLSTGGPFNYDPQTGAVLQPGNVPASATGSAPRAVGGGAGPLGDTMTGISIQNQLQNMNTSGVAGAGSAARRGLRGVNDTYDQQQQRALDEIDQ